MGTRLAEHADVDHIIAISARVQDALTASGSLQQIGPLRPATVNAAVDTQSCFVYTDTSGKVIGCAMSKIIGSDCYPTTPDFTITDYASPWHMVHSIMLEPDVQGQKLGFRLLEDVMKDLQTREGTAILDCWAGNDKLRDFYQKVGFTPVAVVPEEDFEVAVFVWPLGPNSHKAK